MIYGIASAPYFQVSDELNKKADLGVDEIFAAMPADMKRNLDAAAKVQSYATYYGLHHVAYEGGQHLQDHINAGNADAKVAANRDPRMGALIETYLKGWESLGGDTFMYFTLTSGYSKWGSWGLVDDVNAQTSPKYGAILDVINGPAVPLTLGTLVPGAVKVGDWTAMNRWDKPGGASLTVEPGKWVQYDLRAPKSGDYKLVALLGSGENARANITINGQKVGALNVQAGAESAMTSLALNAGLNVIRVMGDKGRFKLQGLKVE